MAPPDDPIQKATFSLSKCRDLFRQTWDNLGSPHEELRRQAEKTMGHFGELARQVTTDSGRPIEGADVAISSLAGSLPELNRLASDRRDFKRQGAAARLLDGVHKLALDISRANKPHRVA
jgi:hypothetical protein